MSDDEENDSVMSDDEENDLATTCIDLTLFVARVAAYLRARDNWPSLNPRLPPWLQCWPRKLQEHILRVNGLVEESCRPDGLCFRKSKSSTWSTQALAKTQSDQSTFLHFRGGLADVMMNSDMVPLGIFETILFFPHELAGALAGLPNSGVSHTAARHLVVYPSGSNLQDLLSDIGLTTSSTANVHRTCRGTNLQHVCRVCAELQPWLRDPRCEKCVDAHRDASRQSKVSFLLGLRTELILELQRRVLVVMCDFDPINNLLHRHYLLESGIVFCTDTTAAILCDKGVFHASHFCSAMFMDTSTGDAWPRIQDTLCNSWLIFFTSRRSAWCEQIIKRDGLLERCTYGDLCRDGRAPHLNVITICSNDMLLEDHTNGGRMHISDSRALTAHECNLIRESPQSRENQYMLLCKLLLAQHTNDGFPGQAIVFECESNTPPGTRRRDYIERCYRQLIHIAAELPASTITRQQLRIGVAYSGVSDRYPEFNDPDRVLAAYTAHDYDIIIVCNIGTRSLVNPFIMYALNRKRHRNTVASMNDQVQDMTRLFCTFRMSQPLLRIVTEKYPNSRVIFQAIVRYIVSCRESNMLQVVTLLELDANFDTNYRNLAAWAKEQGGVDFITATSIDAITAPSIDLPALTTSSSFNLTAPEFYEILVNTPPVMEETIPTLEDGGSTDDAHDDVDEVVDQVCPEALRQAERRRRLSELKQRAVAAKQAFEEELQRQQREDSVRAAFQAQTPRVIPTTNADLEQQIIVKFKVPSSRNVYSLYGRRSGQRMPLRLLDMKPGSPVVVPYDPCLECIWVASDSADASQTHHLDHAALRRFFEPLPEEPHACPICLETDGTMMNVHGDENPRHPSDYRVCSECLPWLSNCPFCRFPIGESA